MRQGMIERRGRVQEVSDSLRGIAPACPGHTIGDSVPGNARGMHSLVFCHSIHQSFFKKREPNVKAAEGYFLSST